jgi:hypothetical protein
MRVMVIRQYVQVGFSLLSHSLSVTYTLSVYLWFFSQGA